MRNFVLLYCCSIKLVIHKKQRRKEKNMKKVIAALLTLCLVFIIVPTVPDNGSENTGISLCEYSVQSRDN